MDGEGLATIEMKLANNMRLFLNEGEKERDKGKERGLPPYLPLFADFARSNNVGSIAAKEEVWEVRRYGPLCHTYGIKQHLNRMSPRLMNRTRLPTSC